RRQQKRLLPKTHEHRQLPGVTGQRDRGAHRHLTPPEDTSAPVCRKSTGRAIGKELLMENFIGRLLDHRYEILEVIGTGGMVVLYKARCDRLNRLVAIKILKDELSEDAEFRRRFHAESQAVAMLSHPNIVNVYDVSHSDNVDYIVMELIDGITVKQYMEQKGVLNWREALHFSTQIAKALEHAHSRGIIHRDIKPHNIMVLKDGSVKVADFGIARVSSA